MGTEDLELTAVAGGAAPAPLGLPPLEPVMRGGTANLDPTAAALAAAQSCVATALPTVAPRRPRRSLAAARRTQPPPAGGAGRQLWGRVAGPQAASAAHWFLLSLRAAAEDRRGGASLPAVDDLYRVSQVDYQYAGGFDGWISPFAAENDTPASDARRAHPAPHVAFDERIKNQSFEYDWLGNNSKTTDDADGFYDRSVGAITNDTAGGKPYQLTAATNVGTATAPGRTGRLDAKYDDAGNLTRLVVVREGACLPALSECSQDYAYQWDEVGRLVDARRWDFAASAAADHALQSDLPASDPAAHLVHAYDSSDQRVRKTAVVGTAERHTLYPMASLELRRAEWSAATATYTRDETTETPYLFGHGVRLARLVYDASVPQSGTGQLHGFVTVGDHLGSTSIAIDVATGELAERVTYQANGATESDYRPGRWGELREDYRFTGKEEDVEVGLQYFGKRFLSPQLGRWVSADPLAVHSEEGLWANPYAYVQGRLLKATDPTGLLDVNWESFRPSNIGHAIAGAVSAAAEAASDTLTMVRHPIDSVKAVGRVLSDAYAKGGVEEVAAALIVDPMVEGYKEGKAAEERGDYRETGRKAFQTATAVTAVIPGPGTVARAANVVKQGRAAIKAAALAAAKAATKESKKVAVEAGEQAVETAGRAAPKAFTAEQKALADMAKADKEAGGVTRGHMKAYKDLNAEAGSAGFTGKELFAVLKHTP